MPTRGPKCQRGYHRVFHLILWVRYTGLPWKCLPVPTDSQGQSAIHDTTVDTVFATWAADGALWQAFVARVRHLAAATHLDRSLRHGDGTNTVAPKGGRGVGSAGYTHQQGDQIIAITDNHGDVCAPVPGAPVHKPDMILRPDGLNAFKQVAKEVGVDRRGAYVNLAGGCDSRATRTGIFNAGLIPNITENPRHRKTTKRGRKRFFNGKRSPL